MRIAVLGRGLSMSVGGTKTYLEEMVPWLPRVDTRNEYALFHGSAAHRGRFPGLREFFLPRAHPLLWDNGLFPFAVRRWRPDLIFCPKNVRPWFLPRDIPTVLLVHDLLYFPLRGVYLNEYAAADVAYMRLFFRAGIRRAAMVVAVSENTRRDVLEVTNIPPERVAAIHHGVSPPAEEALTPAALDRVRRTHGLSQPYVFYPGSLSPRKNMARAIEAFARIASRVPHDLVVTAGKSWKDRPVFEALARHGLRDRFRQLGCVPSSELPALYRMASLCLYPSLYEGFGMPVLEAMACGCPVIASETSSIPEVAGDAALLVNPLDVDALAEAIWRVLTQDALADHLRRRGLSRAASFSWRACTERLVAVFEEARERGVPSRLRCGLF